MKTIKHRARTHTRRGTDREVHDLLAREAVVKRVLVRNDVIRARELDPLEARHLGPVVKAAVLPAREPEKGPRALPQIPGLGSARGNAQEVRREMHGDVAEVAEGARVAEAHGRRGLISGQVGGNCATYRVPEQHYLLWGHPQLFQNKLEHGPGVDCRPVDGGRAPEAVERAR